MQILTLLTVKISLLNSLILILGKFRLLETGGSVLLYRIFCLFIIVIRSKRHNWSIVYSSRFCSADYFSKLNRQKENKGFEDPMRILAFLG